MKWKTLALVMIFLAAAAVKTVFAADAAAVPLATEAEKLSYSFGLNVGASLKQAETAIDLEALFLGVRDVLEGKEIRLAQDEVKQLLENYSRTMQAKQAKRWQEIGEKNRLEGQKFLAENRTKEGVQTTASGLQYTIIKAGDGPVPKETDTVKVHYRGSFIDGTEFDSSYHRNEPAVFPLKNVIRGWTEALQLMKVGGKYRLFIPSELAYGERGSENRIGPNSALVFEVELLAIEN